MAFKNQDFGSDIYAVLCNNDTPPQGWRVVSDVGTPWSSIKTK